MTEAVPHTLDCACRRKPGHEAGILNSSQAGGISVALLALAGGLIALHALAAAVMLIQSTNRGFSLFDARESPLYCASMLEDLALSGPALSPALGPQQVPCLPRRSDYAARTPQTAAPEALCLLLSRLELPLKVTTSLPGGRPCA